MIRLLSLLLAACLWAGTSDAATRYAEASGGIASGGCTNQADPCTAAYMVTQLVAGDIGILLPGTYSALTIEGVNNGTLGNPITLKAQNYAVSCADPDGDPDGCLVNTTSRSTFQGSFQIRNQDYWEVEGIDVVANSSSTSSEIRVQGISSNRNVGVALRFFSYRALVNGNHQLWLQYLTDLELSHFYCTRQAAGTPGDYCLAFYQTQGTTVNNGYCSGNFNHCMSLKRDNHDLTVTRFVCESWESECIFAGQEADDTGQYSSTTSCSKDGDDVDPDIDTLWDHTGVGFVLRNLFARPATNYGTRFGIRIWNQRDLDAQNIFVALVGDSANGGASDGVGIGTIAGQNALTQGSCGVEAGNNSIRGAIVVGAPDAADQNACYRLGAYGDVPATTTLDNLVCHSSGGGSDPALVLNANSNLTANGGFESSAIPTANYRNFVHNDCSTSFSGSTSSLTQQTGAAWNCGTAPAGARTDDPSFAGPESVPFAADPSSRIVNGAALWDWAGTYQPIIDRFDVGNSNYVDAGTGTASPCTGAACDIGANEFFAAVAGTWASCSRYKNIGPYATPNGLDFNDNSPSADTIVRNDGGSWLIDGLDLAGGVTYRIEVHDAENAGNDGIYRITGVTASTLTVTADGGGDAGLVNATDDNTAKIGMRSIQTTVAAPFAPETAGLAIDIDCADKKVVMGVDAVAGSRLCPLSAAPATDCNTAIYFDKDAYLQKGRTQQAVTLGAGTPGSDTDTSGTCWRTRATYDFTESLEDLTGIWGSLQVDPDGGTHNCSASPPSPYWSWQAHD